MTLSDNLPDIRTRRERRLERAEAMLDRWLDLYAAALDDPDLRVDAAKTSELANIFTICKRVLEIDLGMRKLEEECRAGNTVGVVDSNVFGEGISGADTEEPAD